MTTGIGIVGAGRLGQALARRAASAGARVVICNSRSPDTLASFVGDAGPLVEAGTLEAATQPEIVIVAVPWWRFDEVFAGVPDWEGRIVIDATNPVGPDFAPADLGGAVSSEVVAAQLPGAHLVKAFNTLPPRLIAADSRGGGRQVVFLAGDHERSNADVVRLIQRLGFAPIDLGALRTGGLLMQFPGGPLAGLDLVRRD